jgi:D-glycero-beta-D-manno-heptose 1-phosphate adenylyltransferase
MRNPKIVSPPELEVICKRLRQQNGVLVFTNGVFDLLHPGHVDYLTRAKALGTQLIVGINSDSSTRRIKGDKRPIVPLEQRLEVLGALEAVSLVSWFEQDTPEEIIEKVRPDVLVKGGDWPLTAIAGRGFVESYGGQVLSLPFLPGYSTTEIIEKISHL